MNVSLLLEMAPGSNIIGSLLKVQFSKSVSAIVGIWPFGPFPDLVLMSHIIPRNLHSV